MRKSTPTSWLITITFLIVPLFLKAQDKNLSAGAQQILKDSVAIYTIKASKAYQAGDYPTALENYQKTLTFNQQFLLPEDTTLAKNFLNLGNTYFKDKKTEEAALNYQKSIDIYNLHPNDCELEIAELEGRFGAIAFAQKAYEKAESYYQKAIAKIIALKGINDPALTLHYTNLGINYAVRNDYDQALNYFNQAARILIDLHTENYPDVAYVYRSIGKVYEEQRKMEEARKYFEKAIAIRKSTNTTKHPDMGKNYESIGLLHESKRDWEGALKAYHKMLELYQNTLRPNHPYIGQAYFKIGLMHGYMEDYDKALPILERALAITIMEEGEKSIDAAWAYAKIGEFNYYQGNYGKGFIGLQQAIASTVGHFDGTDLDSNPPLDNVILKRTLLQMLDKKVDMSQYHYHTQGKDIQYLKRAFSAGETAVEMINRNKLDYEFDGAKQLLLLNASGLVKNTINVGLLLAGLEDNPMHIARLYQVIEKTRGSLLQEAMTDTRAKLFTNIPSDIQNNEKKLKETLGNYKNRLNNYVSKQEQNMELRDSLDNGIFAVTRSLDSIYRHLKTVYPEYYQLKYNLAVATTKEVSTSLGEETALLEYVLSDSTLFVFAITKDGVNYHKSIVDKQFYQQLKDFRNAINGSHLSQTAREQEEGRKDFIANAYDLYQRLLAPIVDKIGTKKEWIIIPDGLLNYIPFEALITAKPEAPYDGYDNLAYVLKDYRIRYEYSATLLLQGQKKRTAKTELFAGFAPVYEGTNLIAARGNEADSVATMPQGFADLRGSLSPLTNNQPEVKTIASIIGGKSVNGPLATESEFKQAASNYKILHLAMHGFVNDVKPNFSHLVFSEEAPNNTTEDRFLYAYELYNMDLNADLAVLSACETGAGKLQKGEGVMSLSRAFKFAGVPNVIMSLWKADDAKTKDLMIHFYQELKSGAVDSEALRIAKLAAIAKGKDNKEAAHPFYWANFVYIGNGTSIDFEGANYWAWSIGIVGIVAFLLGGFFLRKRKIK